MTADILERLSHHRALATAPPEELAWLAARGELVNLAVGDVLTAKASGTVRGLFVVLSGHLSIYLDRGTGPYRVMDWRGGDVTGLLPYSRLVAPPGDVTAEEPTEILVIDRDHIPAIGRECPGLTAILVHIMLDRARVFTSSDLQNEKMSSLGKLAAGLAHELNNPASAVARSADALAHRLLEVETASRTFGGVALTGAQQAAFSRARALTMTTNTATHGRSAMDRADHEERISDWLDDHGVDPASAGALVDSAITEEALENLAASLDGAPLTLALELLVSECAAHQLVTEIHTSAQRIYKLVAAVKGFTYMDQGTAQQPVDVRRGLEDTFVILNHKARSRSLNVTVDVEPDLPPVLGLGGGLNQVWANLADNALDAAAHEVSVSAVRHNQCVVVRFVDDGPGIPAEIQKRIFDPFFTTKPPGQGTGLGLDTVRRLVNQHRGDISVDSRPGRTEFTVKLQIDPGKI